MANLFDYIAWRGDLSFSQSPLNPVDFMVFSQISYLPFDDIAPELGNKNALNLGLALEILLDRLHTGEPERRPVLNYKEDPDLINALISSERYRNCHILGFVNNIDDNKEIQFSAICFYLGHKLNLIVYRGTDANFVGWKEDFNMAFREEIPSQKEAVKYLEEMAGFVKGKIYLAGHSKGGNLAAYAASFCEKKIQKRIDGIYSYDAPGFHESVITSGGYNKIKQKINSFIPQSSIVGLLLEHGCAYNVVKSAQKGLLQHFLFSWEVTRDNFVPAEKLGASSRLFDKTMREWIGNLNNEQREQFVEGLYKILLSSNAKSFHEMEASWLLSLGRIIKSIGNIDESARKATLKAMSDFFKTAGRNFETLFKRQESEQA